MSAPIEAKVKVSTAASGLAALVLGAASQYLFKGGEVPDALEVFITSTVLSGVTSVVTFLAGWTAKHTPRIVRVDADTTGTE